MLFVGLGWWLLLDLSVEGYYSNRFHALYQQIYVFAAFVLLSLLPTLRLGLAHGLARWFGRFLLMTRPRSAGIGADPGADAGPRRILRALPVAAQSMQFTH